MKFGLLIRTSVFLYAPAKLVYGDSILDAVIPRADGRGACGTVLMRLAFYGGGARSRDHMPPNPTTRNGDTSRRVGTE
jgi:hypothetical protein